MSDQMIMETDDVYHKKVHSDAGDGYGMECPNCRESVTFADGQWWRSTCGCGEWSLEIKAVLEVRNEDD